MHDVYAFFMAVFKIKWTAPEDVSRTYSVPVKTV